MGGMDATPSPLLLNTYRLAAGLKVVGILCAVALGYAALGNGVWDRWWMAFLTAGLLLLILFPWDRGRRQVNGTLRRRQLHLALAVGLLGPFADLVQSSWRPYAALLANPRYADLGWRFQDINGIHALGLLFLMVPVLLASWQYGLRGFAVTMLAAGLLYLATPLLLPDDTFYWPIYYVRGFVLLGVTLILAFTVGALASAQRREEARQRQLNTQLVDANRRLADHAATLENLATSRERNRLARELHDTLAHALSGTAVQLQAVKTLLQVDPAAAAAELHDAERQIRHGLSESRRAIGALRAAPLETLGLAEALRQRATTLAQRAELALTCRVTSPSALSPLAEQTLFRIADEALRNVEQHAAAGTVLVALAQAPDGVRLEIADDGLGFDPATTLPERFGLLGMSERAALIGAQLRIESAPGAGTRINIWLPQSPYAS